MTFGIDPHTRKLVRTEIIKERDLTKRTLATGCRSALSLDYASCVSITSILSWIVKWNVCSFENVKNRDQMKRRGKNLENCWSRIKNNIFLHGQPKGVNTGTEGAIESVLIQTGCSYLAGLQVMSHLLSEQNNKETKEDISIVKLIIFDLHKAVILRIKSTSKRNSSFSGKFILFVCQSIKVKLKQRSFIIQRLLFY